MVHSGISNVDHDVMRGGMIGNNLTISNPMTTVTTIIFIPFCLTYVRIFRCYSRWACISVII